MSERTEREEVQDRIERVRQQMEESGYDALLVYGNNKINGSLRYLSGYWPDRGGWLATGPHRSDIKIFDGATLLIARGAEPLLVLDKGQLLDRDTWIETTTVSGFGGELATSPSEAQAIVNVLKEAKAHGHVGIETWDKFPAPFYLELQAALPDTRFSPSTLVEQAALVKSSWEIDIFRRAGQIGDLGHQAFVDALLEAPDRTEVELIRQAEAAMRVHDPVYEEISPISPSLISSGKIGRLHLLHTPQDSKRVSRGDAVNWDIGMRYLGYPVDTSRTRVLGKADDRQRRAYDAALEMRQEVLSAVRPGVEVQDLVALAEKTAEKHGFELWDRFLGHGLGLDVHSRPDMGAERMVLVENMLITVEPRLALDDAWLFGNEDMVLVTADGCETLTNFPVEPLDLDI
jgi:Xaa-Pro aminopeptidase